jgi:hypothetical protein
MLKIKFRANDLITKCWSNQNSLELGTKTLDDPLQEEETLHHGTTVEHDPTHETL